jgi:hypothetical protein
MVIVYMLAGVGALVVGFFVCWGCIEIWDRWRP